MRNPEGAEEYLLDFDGEKGLICSDGDIDWELEKIIARLEA